MTKQSIRYTEEFKQEVLNYNLTHTNQETCDKYNVSKYSITKWKGWTRKNVKDSNKKWYESKGKDYYLIPENRKRNTDNTKNYRLNNPESTAISSKKFSDAHRLSKLSEYANRTFYRKGKIDYHKLSAFDLWKIAKKQRLICPISGYKLTGENISVDHILAISKGGTNDPSNIRLVDKWVNIMLYTKTDDEFFKICKDILSYNNL